MMMASRKWRIRKNWTTTVKQMKTVSLVSVSKSLGVRPISTSNWVFIEARRSRKSSLSLENIHLAVKEKKKNTTTSSIAKCQRSVMAWYSVPTRTLRRGWTAVAWTMRTSMRTMMQKAQEERSSALASSELSTSIVSKNWETFSSKGTPGLAKGILAMRCTKSMPLDSVFVAYMSAKMPKMHTSNAIRMSYTTSAIPCISTGSSVFLAWRKRSYAKWMLATIATKTSANSIP
mmetsp:Transcript_58464/g.137278  ORF Transcript_58464/g.137278 Transcript_58464/m.137278 type:complete len:232 (-) Transcript_58464:4048-4743(-)